MIFCVHNRHLKKGRNKCPLFSQSGLCKDRWPHAEFLFFSPPVFFFQLLWSAAGTGSADCPGSSSWQLCWEQRRKGKGEGCLQGEVRQESAFTIPLTPGQGQTECTAQNAPSGHKLSPTLEGAWEASAGQKKDRFVRVDVLPLVRTADAGMQSRIILQIQPRNIPQEDFSGCRGGRSGESGGGERG